jgi:glycerol-3-phosphate dehydrogenase (NAD+)
MSADQITADMSKASIDETKVSPTSEAPSSPASPAPSNLFDGSAPSGFSTPDTSRPPSPLLKPLQVGAGVSSRGLPSKPHGFNVLSGASMGFSSVSNNAPKKPTAPKPSTASDFESDDEGSVDGAQGTDAPRAPPVRRTSSAAMAPFIAKFDLFEPTVVVDHKNGTQSPARLEKVAIVGSGSWGTALARVAAINTAERDGFDPEVRMWVRERVVCCVQAYRVFS